PRARTSGRGASRRQEECVSWFASLLADAVIADARRTIPGDRAGLAAHAARCALVTAAVHVAFAAVLDAVAAMRDAEVIGSADEAQVAAIEVPVAARRTVGRDTLRARDLRAVGEPAVLLRAHMILVRRVVPHDVRVTCAREEGRRSCPSR